jgi:hypothetical protein
MGATRRSRGRGALAVSAASALAIAIGLAGASQAIGSPSPVDAYGSFVDNSHDYITVYLFANPVSGTYSSTPVSRDTSNIDFSFADLSDGDYLLGFFDEDTAQWVPWVSHNLDAIPTSSTPGSDCGIAFTVSSAAHGDYDFGDVAVDIGQPGDYCDLPPWAAPGSGSVSGTIQNPGDRSNYRVSLYYAYSGSLSPLPVDTTSVAADGTYHLDGVTENGNYVLAVSAGRDDPYLDVYSGGTTDYVADLSNSWSSAISDAAALAGGDDQTFRDITLPDAHVLRGTVVADGDPVIDLCIEAYSLSVSDDDFCEPTDASGDFSIKVVPASDYVLFVDGYSGSYSPFFPAYDDQYYDGVDTEADATVIDATATGIDSTSYDFDLTPFLANVLGIVLDDSGATPLLSSDQVDAYLYLKSGSGWKKIDKQRITDASGPGFSYFLFPDFASGDPFTELEPGDYRVRFRDSSGWVGFEYAQRISPPYGDDDYVEFEQGCSITFPNVKPGPDSIALIQLDLDRSVKHCSSSSGSGASSAGSGASHLSQVLRDYATDDESFPEPTPTPTPTPAPTLTETAPPTTAATPNPTDDGALDFGPFVLIAIILGGIILIGGGIVLVLRFR